MHHLPRAGLILFLVAIVIVFREVLLPFVLAVFFSYLIYPVVNLIERLPIGKRHPPRWLAVITVYAMLFTVGWNAVPPLLRNFAEQIGKLGNDLPSLFSWVQTKRKGLDGWIARKLEVTELSEITRREIYGDVDALAREQIESLPPAEDQELLPAVVPAPTITESAPTDPRGPTVIQIFGINVQWSSKPTVSPTVPSSAATPPGSSAVDPAVDPEKELDPPSETENGDPGESDTAQTEKPRLFSEEQAEAFKIELKDVIYDELKKPGAAKGLSQRVEQELVPALARKHLGLPDNAPGLNVLARNTGQRIANAVKQEQYANVINGYFVSGVESARAWIQEQLKQLTGLVTGLVRGVFDFFMILMLTAFFLVFFPRIRDYLRDLVAPHYRDDYAIVLKRIDIRLSGAIRGQVIICLVNATLTFPGMWFIGSHTQATSLASYSVLLSIVAGVLSMIPIFGVIISTVPMVILALTQGSIWGSVLVIGWISIVHAIEAYLLNPNILGHSASINPIIVVFALLAGKHFGGLTGALLAVPMASVVVSLFGYYRRLVAEQHAAETGVTLPADTWGD